MLQRLEILVIRTTRWSELIEWYRDVLGLSIRLREDEHQWCELELHGGGPRLAILGSKKAGTSIVNRVVPDFLVTDLDSTVSELQKRGVEIQGNITTGEDFRIATCRDPDGNELQVFEQL